MVDVSCRGEFDWVCMSWAWVCMSWAEIECTWVEFQGEFSVSYLSWVWVCLSWVSGGVQFLVSKRCLNWLNCSQYQLVQLVEIQGESLVQGEFLVIPLVLLSKGERDLCIYIIKFEKLRWPIWKEFWKSGWLSIDGIKVVANCGCQCMVIRVVANNSKGGDCCSQWSLCCSCWHQYWSICELAPMKDWKRFESVWMDFEELKCWFHDEYIIFELRYEKLIC